MAADKPSVLPNGYYSALSEALRLEPSVRPFSRLTHPLRFRWEAKATP
jgi:hypothetical protein